MSRPPTHLIRAVYAAVILVLAIVAIFCFASQPALARHSSAMSQAIKQNGGIAVFALGPSFYDANYVLQCNPWLIKPPAKMPPVSSLAPGRGPLLPPGGLVVPPRVPLAPPAGVAPPPGGAGLPALIARAGPGTAGPAGDRVAVRAAFLRGVSREMRRSRAAQFVRFGDQHFRKQQYNDALERYKDAGRNTVEVAEPYFRQAFAWAAMSRYGQAAKSLRRGLEIDAAWPAAGFQLKELYADNRLAKNSHWDAIAKAATENPQDADLLFLLAVELYCDGQQDRSRAFFERAQSLELGDTSHIKAFLDQLSAPAKPPVVAGR